MKCAVLSALLFITPQDGEAAGDAGSVEWAGEWEVPGEAVQALDAVKQRVIGVSPGVPGGLLWSPKTSLFGYASGDSVGALHGECVCVWVVIPHWIPLWCILVKGWRVWRV